MSSSEFRKRKEEMNGRIDETIDNLQKGHDECARVENILINTRYILDDLDQQFSQKTGLTEIDLAFLFTAIGMQIVRQYLVTKFQNRLDDKEAAKRTWGHGEEHSNRHHRYYNPSLEEIITNPVPFDANIGANGALRGGGQMGHRVTAIGHDPLLGLIFGTANIATATLTTASFESYHIYTNDQNQDYFCSHADTGLVLGYTVDKLLNQGIEGKKIVAVALMKEIIHLQSDLYTKNSLPLPIISAINPGLAAELARYGLDMANLVTVGKQASYAVLINTMIAMVHRLFFQGGSDMERKLYEVRTRKILSYSNLVASSSNIAVVAITGDMTNFDLGGLAVTIYRLITDRKFIRQVKEEFIYGSYRDMIMGDY